MIKKAFLKPILILVAVTGILTALSSCDYWISNSIVIENNESYYIDEIYIEYNDGSRTPPQYDILSGGEAEFFVSYYESDKYGSITIVAWDEYNRRWESTGNIAENDWVTLVDFANDFYLTF